MALRFDDPDQRAGFIAALGRQPTVEVRYDNFYHDGRPASVLHLRYAARWARPKLEGAHAPSAQLPVAVIERIVKESSPEARHQGAIT